MNYESELKYDVYFEIPLSGSKLFDINAEFTARNICASFPGLHFKLEERKLIISGRLNEYWYNNWKETMDIDESIKEENA